MAAGDLLFSAALDISKYQAGLKQLNDETERATNRAVKDWADMAHKRTLREDYHDERMRAIGLRELERHQRTESSFSRMGRSIANNHREIARTGTVAFGAVAGSIGFAVRALEKYADKSDFGGGSLKELKGLWEDLTLTTGRYIAVTTGGPGFLSKVHKKIADDFENQVLRAGRIVAEVGGRIGGRGAGGGAEYVEAMQLAKEAENRKKQEDRDGAAEAARTDIAVRAAKLRGDLVGAATLQADLYFERERKRIKAEGFGGQNETQALRVAKEESRRMVEAARRAAHPGFEKFGRQSYSERRAEEMEKEDRDAAALTADREKFKFAKEELDIAAMRRREDEKGADLMQARLDLMKQIDDINRSSLTYEEKRGLIAEYRKDSEARSAEIIKRKEPSEDDTAFGRSRGFAAPQGATGLLLGQTFGSTQNQTAKRVEKLSEQQVSQLKTQTAQLARIVENTANGGGGFGP